MKKGFYLIAILALLLQPVLSFLPAASARQISDVPLAPTAQILYVSPGGSGTCTTSWANACGLQTALGAVPSSVTRSGCSRVLISPQMALNGQRLFH